MSEQFERAVARVLETGAAGVSPRTDGLAEAVIARSRRGRIRGAGGVAVAAAVVVAAVVLVAGYALPQHHGPGPGPSAADTPKPTPTAAADRVLDLDPLISAARPAAVVWPQAVRSFAAPLPNGHRFNVIGAAPGGAYVVQETSGFESSGSVYRLGTDGRATKIIDAKVVNPSTTAFTPVDRAWLVDGGRTVALQTMEGDGVPNQIVAVSVTDGRPVAQVRLDPPQNPRPIAWAGGRLIWTNTTDGVTAIYGADQPTRPLQGSTGFELTGEGTWAYRTSRTQVFWWDVASGARHTVSASIPLVGGTWALGRATDSDEQWEVVTLDGLRYRARASEISGYYLYGDHFMVLERTGTDPLVLDLREGKLAVLDGAGGNNALVSGSGHDIIPLPGAMGNTRMVVLDLAAI